MISRLLVFVALVLMAPGVVRADGLIYRLPPDGSWATYRMHMHMTGVETLKGEVFPDEKASGTFTLRSVGEVMADGRATRWIELEFNVPPTKDRPGRIIILKMLVPVKRLRRGADPLLEVEELFFWDRNWSWQKDPEKGRKEKLTDKARILYEIERFRQQFPFPPQKLEDVRTDLGVEVKTPLDTYRAQKISYPVKFQGKLSGGKGGRWQWQGDYSLWLSEDVPFGVVAVETVNSGEEEYAGGNGIRWKNATIRLELESVDKGGKFKMPDLP